MNQTERLQRTFNVLTGLFDQVVLRNNKQKTVIMACKKCHAPERMSVEAYERRTMGTGPTYQEIKWSQVQCPECRVEVATGSLLMHCQSHHSVIRGDQPPPPPPGGGPNSPFLFTKKSVAAPFSGRWGAWVGLQTGPTSRFTLCTTMFRKKNAILEEGNQPYPWCNKQDMFMLHRDLNVRNLTTAFFHRGEER